MALPVVVPVGEDTARNLRDRLVKAIAGLRVGISTDPEAEYGPVVSAQHKARIEDHIQVGVDEGAELGSPAPGSGLQGYRGAFFSARPLLALFPRPFGPYRERLSGRHSQAAPRTPSPGPENTPY